MFLSGLFKPTAVAVDYSKVANNDLEESKKDSKQVASN